MVVFRSDPCGITCIIVTYIAILYADYVVVRHLVIPAMSASLWGALNVLIFNMIVFMMVVAHLRAVLSDPGIVPLPKSGLDFSDIHSGKQSLMEYHAMAVTIAVRMLGFLLADNFSWVLSVNRKLSIPVAMRDGWSLCMKCETYRPPRAHHCRICERCIRKMDHHCPWINNCVGELNQKFFMQFLFYVGLAAVHATSMVIVSWILDPGVKGDNKHFKLIHSIILVIESLLFGLFVIAIGCDQLSSIFDDTTAVEYVKKDGPRRNKTKWSLMQEVFGKGHPLLWLCPITDSVPRERVILHHV